MNLENRLREIGFEEREIKIYLATLELGESTVLPIAQKAGIKRTYSYDILERLREQGLVTYVLKNGRRRYSADPPEKIEQMLRNRLENFSRILPELRSLYNRAEAKPKVRFYEGLDGLQVIYTELIDNPEYMAIAPGAEVEKYFHDHINALAEEVLKRNIRARELVAKSPKSIDFIKRYQSERQQVRWLPYGVKIETDLLMYGNKLAMISYGQNIHAVVIEDSVIVETHKQLFELLWTASKERD